MPERTYIRRLRYIVQFAFLLLTLYAGWQFYLFAGHFEHGGNPFVERPPSVDAFLPIAGLMSLKYFLFTGIIEPIHPSALVIFAAVLLVSLLFRKGFCGWLCPVGTVSQYIWMAGERILGRNFRFDRVTDAIVKSVKYMLLFLFILLIGIAMPPNMMVLFFITDYYKAVDVRMMKFFTEMTGATFWALAVLVGLSLIYKNFWCRYLCPYGALLGLLGRISPFRVKRAEKNCAHCGACSRHCPSLIDVEKKDEVKSTECMSCLTCVSRCPSGALTLSAKAGGWRMTIKPYLYPVLLIAVFYLVIGLGMVSGKWKSQLPYEEYARIIPEISNSE